MAVTHGHGNPNWTRDETILALDLYFYFEGHIPSRTDKRVQDLSDQLRSFPYHARAARQKSFRNPDGVAFKLQNIRNVATGKGLANVSKMDHQVWNELGNNPLRTKELANLIREGLEVVEGVKEETEGDEAFSEGKMVTEAHLRRERQPKIRKRLLEERKKAGQLACEMCGCRSAATNTQFAEAMFEAHHVLPLSLGKERITRLKDMALLCANCHRMIHRAISIEKLWLSVAEAKSIIFGGKNV